MTEGFRGDRFFLSNFYPSLRQALLDTGDDLLVEYNSWGDRLWGVDESTGEGQNLLGKILMDERERRRCTSYRS